MDSTWMLHVGVALLIANRCSQGGTLRPHPHVHMHKYRMKTMTGNATFQKRSPEWMFLKTIHSVFMWMPENRTFR